MLDDNSVRRVLSSVVATQPRNYVIMEVKSNLIKAEREELLMKFNTPHYRKVAEVVMGTPTEEFTAKMHELMLAEKQELVEAEWKLRKAEAARRKEQEQRQKQLEELKRKEEEQFAQKAADVAKAMQDAAMAELEATANDVAEEVKKEGEEV